jgi:hypothetical protein
MEFLVGQAPQRAQERQEQKRFLGIDAWRPAWTRGQRQGALLVGQLHRHATDHQQLQAGDQRQRVQMQRRSHRPVIGGRGNRRLINTK